MQRQVSDWSSYLACYNQLDEYDPNREYLVCCTIGVPPDPPTQNPYPNPIPNPDEPDGPNGGNAVEGRSSISIDIYPNPVTQIMTISGISENTSATIYNTEGKRVYYNLVAESGHLDLYELPDGIYFISLKRSGKVIYEKQFIKVGQ